ncbi:MAG: helix-turn-helix domain-containing protein [Acidobacteriaceae bacterium]|nr:helix-turn-helix domain-containing protein [Acidobacteriaceae bacterium]MBV9500786.1 helix-turn-helix domain-containing protein [Acidobacteriaceae bacterium]
MVVRTRLREIRKLRGFSAADLAHRVGVSRQTIYSIEDGSFVPNTTVSLQLARALDVTVEEIFSIPEELEHESISADLLAADEPAKQGQLVRFCRVDERLMAIPLSAEPAYLPPADGIIESRSRHSVSIRSPAGFPENAQRLLLAGCDPALSLLNELLGSSNTEIISVPCSSHRALEWLKQRRVHAAGSHLLDLATGEYNIPLIRRLFPNGSVRVVNFAVWEQGLVLAAGNPKRISSIADLGRKDVTIVNREKGSGSRALLDTGLRRAGIKPDRVKGYSTIAQGHLSAGHAVAAGTADCCIAPLSASRCFGLDFIPLATERFDLSFNKAALELPAAKALLDLLNRSRFQRKLETIAGYDTAHTGEVLI